MGCQGVLDTRNFYPKNTTHTTKIIIVQKPMTHILQEYVSGGVVVVDHDDDDDDDNEGW